MKKRVGMVLALAVLTTGMLLGIAAPGMARQHIPATGAGETKRQAPSTTITGVVYRDFNANGVRDTATGDTNTTPQFPEPGVGGVTVTAYPASASGTSGAVSTTTARDGTFSLNVGSGQWRIEVTNLPSYLFDGAAGTTTVVFANVGDHVEIGVNNPAQYSQPDPAIVTMLMSQGAITGPYQDNAGLISMRRSVVGADAHNGTVTGDPYAPPDYTELSKFKDVGATYGLAWDRTHGYLYSAAFHKYLVGYGPGGRGQIYRTPVDPSTGQATGAPQQWVNVESDLGFTLCGGHGGDIDSPPSAYEQTYFDQVGRCGLGDIDISWDDSTLYAILIDNNKVIGIDTSSGALSGQWIIPPPSPPYNCTGNIYAFGMATKDDKVYVGLSCDKEAMVAVLELTPATNTWRTLFAFDPTQDPNSNEAVDPSNMNPWITDISQADNQNGYRAWRQIIVGDLAFFGEDITIGIRDRMGDQWGHKTPDPQGGLTNTQPFGNLWCAYYDTSTGSYVYPRREGGSYSQYVAQTCGPNRSTKTPSPSPEWFGGEFYWGDGTNKEYGVTIHSEAVSGALAQWLLDDVAVSSKTPQDALGYSDTDRGGTLWINNVDGAPTHAFEIYKADVGQFGKANGLGDLEALSYPAPLEIGNRLWCDIGVGGVGAENGVQDPGEPVISGATVVLECDTNDNPGDGYEVSATTTTDANGQYLFRDGDASLSSFPTAPWDNTIHIIPRNAQCRITIDPTQSAIANSCGGGNYSATLADQGGTDAGADKRDSDGQENVDGAGNVGTVFTTGSHGQNNHDLDFGFTQVQVGSLGDFVWDDADADGVQDAGESGIQNVTVELYANADCSGTAQATTTTDNNGTYSFPNLTPGTYSIKFTLPSGYVFSPANQGSDTTDSDADPTTGCTGGITLSAGQNDTTWDAGMVQTTPHLLIDKDTSTPSVSPGGEATYTIVVRNDGSGVATGVIITDTLPEPFTYYRTLSIQTSGPITRTETITPVNTLLNNESYIYAFGGKNTPNFWRYDLDSATWQVMANAPGNVHAGGDMALGNGYIYGMGGGSTNAFWRYDPASDTWDDGAATDVPLPPGKEVGTGGALTYDDRYIYAIVGGNDSSTDNDLWRYDPVNDTWSLITYTPVPQSGGSDITYGDGYIYFLGGNNGNDDTATWGAQNPGYEFYRYHIASDTWERLQDLPNVEPAKEGAAIVFHSGTVLGSQPTTSSVYAWLGGDTQLYYRYDIATNTWIQDPPADSPQRVENGSDLCSDGSHSIYGFPATDTQYFQLYDTDSDNWSQLTQTPAQVQDGGALLCALGNGTPKWGTWDIGVGGAITITFAVQVSPNAPIGTYDNTAYANAQNYHPIDDDGTQAQDADTPAGVDPEDDEDVTVIRGSIGNLVWWDIDRDGVQDPGEPGIPDVTLTLSGTSSGNTTTDASGIYTFANLLPGNYTVKVDDANFTTGVLQDWQPSPQNVGDDSTDSDGDPTTHDVDVTLSANQVDDTIDFGFTITTSYTITKELNTPEPVRPGNPISFTILITNTGKSWLATLPLQDTYNTGYLIYGYGGQYAQPDSDDHIDDGAIDWSDALGGTPLAPGLSHTVVITFTAKADTTQLPGSKTRNVARAHDGTADPDGPSGPLGALEPLPERSDEAQVAIINPTGLVLGSFRATSRDGGVALRWRTVNESRIAGFRLLRAVDVRGRLTASREIAFIPARHSGMAQGQRYQAWDDQVRAGVRYRYWLEVVRVDGSTYRLPPRSVWILRISPYLFRK